MKLSVVIPAYNEEDVIVSTCTEVKDYLVQHFGDEAELMVIDDGSTDDTAQRLRQLSGLTILRHERNRGKGAAVRTGFRAAVGDYVLFMDADNSTRIQELPAFLDAATTGAQVIVASRALTASRVVVAQHWIKQVLGKMGNRLIQLLLVPGIQDTQCGFKMFARQPCQVLFQLQTIERWAFDIELLALARWQKLRIAELPVRWENNFNSKVKPRDYLTTLMAVFGVQLNRLLGKYRYDRQSSH